MKSKTFGLAFKASMPVILGYLPTGFAFGLMITTAGYNIMLSVIMSVVMYAGAGQYLAVDFILENSGYIKIALLTFLVNSKHLFYGLSLLNDYKDIGIKKLYLIFSLTDETYAVLTGPMPEGCDRTKFCIYVSIIDHLAWVTGTLLGGLIGTAIDFNTEGLTFAMTALFIVIAMGQWKNAESKIPFAVGVIAALFSFYVFGSENILLAASVLTVVILILLRKRIEKSAAN